MTESQYIIRGSTALYIPPEILKFPLERVKGSFNTRGGIREESKTGKSIYAVIDQGFSQAFKTIIDSNTTTLLVAIILFYFGSGPVKGFAVTLSAGILASMFSAIFLTKIFIYSWVKLYKPKEIVI